MRIKTLTFTLVLFVFYSLYSQQITIESVNNFEENNTEYFIIKFTITNNTDVDMLFPMKTDMPYNFFSYFYIIETKPKKAFGSFDHPPLPVGAPHYKLTKEDIVICPANSSIEIVVDTRKLYGGAMYLKRKIQDIRKIKISYIPFNIANTKENLSEEIISVKFYDKKIESKFFNIKKN